MAPLKFLVKRMRPLMRPVASLGVHSVRRIVHVEIWTLNVTLYMSQQFCGQVQSFWTVFDIICASAVRQLPHREVP